jgi:hypothetical protein
MPIGDWPTFSNQQGWQCPRCGRVWSPTFPGPCVCHNEFHKISTGPHTGTHPGPKNWTSAASDEDGKI